MAHRLILNSILARARAHALIDLAPIGFIMSIFEPRRSNAQNDKMWAMLTDISVAKPEGRRHTPDDWKAIMMNACGWEVQFLEGLDGRPFPTGFRSSNLTKRQMGNLIDYMQAYGDMNNVRWTDPETLKREAENVEAA